MNCHSCAAPNPPDARFCSNNAQPEAIRNDAAAMQVVNSCPYP